MDSEIADLNRLFTFGLSQLKGKSVSKLEAVYGNCNSDLDNLFAMMTKNMPFKTSKKVTLFGFLLDDEEESLKKRCAVIIHKASRDIVILGVFRKSFDGTIYFHDHCVLNELITVTAKEDNDKNVAYFFKVNDEINKVPELSTDCFSLFVRDICDIHSNSRNKAKISEIMVSIRKKAFIQYRLYLQDQEKKTAIIEKIKNQRGPINTTAKYDPSDDLGVFKNRSNRALVGELRKRIAAGENGLFDELLKMDDSAYACQAIAGFYNNGIEGTRNFEKAIYYYKKAAEGFNGMMDQRYVECMNQIASIYCDREFPKADFKEALKWFCLGKYTSAESYYQHAYCCFILQDYEAAFRSAVRSIELRKRKGYYILGKMLSDEEIKSKVDFLETDYQLAARCFEESQKTRTFKYRSKIQLAFLLLNDKVTVNDSPAALSALINLSKSKKGGWAVELGRAYYFGKYGLARDFEKADVLFSSSNIEDLQCKTVCALAFSELILRGLSNVDKKNVKEIIDITEKNNPDNAQLLVSKGIYLYHGLGYQVDKKMACDYFSRCLSVHPNDLTALSYITMLKIEGFDVKQGVLGSINYLIELSSSDNYHGQRTFINYLIAECFYYGKGTKVDYERALDYYQKAIDSSQAIKIFPVFSKMLECMNKIGVDDKERYLDIALKSKHSSDDKAEEIAGDLLMEFNELSALKYYYESSRNGNPIAKGKYQRLLTKYPGAINEDVSLTQKKIESVEYLKSELDLKFGKDNISSKRCERMIGLLSGDLSLEDLDDGERAIIRDDCPDPQTN